MSYVIINLCGYLPLPFTEKGVTIKRTSKLIVAGVINMTTGIVTIGYVIAANIGWKSRYSILFLPLAVPSLVSGIFAFRKEILGFERSYFQGVCYKCRWVLIHGSLIMGEPHAHHRGFELSKSKCFSKGSSFYTTWATNHFYQS